MNRLLTGFLLAACLVGASASPAAAQGEWEVTPASEQSLHLGLEWLAANQGPQGNWESDDLGLVSVGALAFLAAGHAPGRGRYGEVVERALAHVVERARPSGLLNIAHPQRDMYNHGLATFVLGQAYGMTTSRDRRLGAVLDRALRLISETQCDDGGWDYQATRQPNGHDLSLAVMQAKALRSAVDSGFEAPPEVIDLAIRSVREHYAPAHGQFEVSEAELMKGPGQFTYGKGGSGGTLAMAAAGVVCLQEFGQYGDWRIAKNVEVISTAVQGLPKNPPADGSMPFDAYTLYYVGQALYQVGGDEWRACYPILRDYLTAAQVRDAKNPARHGVWNDRGAAGGGRVGGRPGDLYAVATACFVLSIPNRYLPILQEGKIEGFQQRFGAE